MDVHEPKINWGGDWTENKLNAFENYVKAYLKIMNKQKKKFNNWPNTLYFDGFAGSGERLKFENEEYIQLFSDYLEEKEYTVYKGSAERVLSLNEKFDYYYFIDIDRESIESLRKKLEEKGLISDKCNFKCGDVNNEIKIFTENLDSKMAALVLLDPFGMQIRWESIELFRDKRVDLWILIPSGVIINRCLNKTGEIRNVETLENFFGMNEEDIKKYFYDIENVDTLYGSDEKINKTRNSIQKIANLYVSRLKTIFKYVTDKPLELINSRNVIIYHFVFASNNETAHKIASQIIGKRRK